MWAARAEVSLPAGVPPAPPAEGFSPAGVPPAPPAEGSIPRRIKELRARWGLFSCAVLLASAAAGAQPENLGDGIYTRQQAKFGERLYRTHCVACHDRNYFGPVLKAWTGQPLSALYETMYWTMPQANPGGLREHEYLALLAYALSLNRLPSGASELTAERLPDIFITP